MSLDSVELVMAWEEEFVITISDGEAEKTATVGEASDLIHRKLQQSLSGSAEETVFRAIAEVSGRSIESIRRELQLVELFPRENREKAWSELQTRIGYEAIPNLTMPAWLSWIGWILALGTFAMVLPRLGWAVAASLTVGVLWGLATQRIRRICPPPELTVGRVVGRVEAQQAKFRENQRMGREAIREKVVEITAEQLGVKPEQCTDDARFIQDLGVD